MTRISILESKWKKIYPYSDNVLVIKDEDECISAGGIVIPDAAQQYKRRGWVLAVGGGVRTNGKLHLPPYKPGDYLIADRPFSRPDETEDELFQDPSILMIRGDEPLAYIRREDCVGPDAKRAFPAKYQEILDRFGFKPGGE